jgi:hypothetical protein
LHARREAVILAELTDATRLLNAIAVGDSHPAALAQLPADERAAWQQFWADVAELLKKAGTQRSSSDN